ncbi:hypothetical protein [Romboutsia lituseburensis]|uniref:Uncharacterized protein n=1 Tax=Romboutsia lituseburensis DSM 797 TaxID=1121325 RepID=A0A1G9TN86_9FIRM|nr:hypothetical protein [Romboutsia lituseburensis]CEH32637.1 Hypothetical protein RLITU_0023 [Romboutsia lituseburensis]SDM49236.1 hypothetical protein SAMN04515677_11324 [Romboutsia lituseburensis DSM 797]
MAKKRKIKKSMLFAIGLVLFFIIYFVTFNFASKMEVTKSDPVESENQEEDTRPLINQISTKEKIYLSHKDRESVRVESEYWEKVKVLFSEFSKIRKPGSYDPIYSGHSDDGVRFSTDLNYFRVYTVSKEEYYKVPVETKNELEKLLGESIYLSFDFVKQYKSWKTVEISYNNDVKKVHKWKFDDLSYKMGSKRIVGKVQPEKSKERSKYNFKISIHGEYYDTTIETMGKDYVKITAGSGKEKAQAYYEVHTALYDYLLNDIFELESTKK